MMSVNHKNSRRFFKDCSSFMDSANILLKYRHPTHHDVGLMILRSQLHTGLWSNLIKRFTEGVSPLKMPTIVLERDFVISKDCVIRLPITDPLVEELREYFQHNFNIDSVEYRLITKNSL